MEEKVTVISSERAMILCARSLRDDAAEIKRMIDNAEAEAFLIGECCFITRFETSTTGKELVVMCAEGKGVNPAVDILRKLAKKHGCTTARIHTQRPALQRLMPQLGLVQSEIIFKMEI